MCLNCFSSDLCTGNAEHLEGLDRSTSHLSEPSWWAGSHQDKFIPQRSSPQSLSLHVHCTCGVQSNYITGAPGIQEHGAESSLSSRNLYKRLLCVTDSESSSLWPKLANLILEHTNQSYVTSTLHEAKPNFIKFLQNMLVKRKKRKKKNSEQHETYKSHSKHFALYFFNRKL